MFTNKGEKLGEILVCLRLMLPGSKENIFVHAESIVVLLSLAHDSTDNLVGLSMISDSSNPPSRRNSFGASDYQKVNGTGYNIDSSTVSLSLTRMITWTTAYRRLPSIERMPLYPTVLLIQTILQNKSVAPTLPCPSRLIQQLSQVR